MLSEARKSINFPKDKNSWRSCIHIRGQRVDERMAKTRRDECVSRA